MGKRLFLVGMVMCIQALLPGESGFHVNDRWINPEGWKLPDTSNMVKTREKTAGIFRHDGKIVIETFTPSESPTRYFDKKIALENGRYLVYLDCEVRAEIQGVHVYKDQHGRVLMYFINCLMPERVVANDRTHGFHNAGYSASGEQYILVDLDGDGTFESQYSESAAFWNDITRKGVPEYFQTDPERSRNSIVFNLLETMLNKKKGAR